MPVEVLNGWFVIVRRSAIQRIGSLDPRFFMYAEDLDWCYRFHKAGEKVVFFAGAEAIHYGGASSSTAPVRFYLEMARANWQYWQKHYGRAAQIAFLATSALYDVLRILGSAGLYLFLPAKRSSNIARARRSAACLGRLLERDPKKPQRTIPAVRIST
jgi:GT2 family glycosyltransferase